MKPATALTALLALTMATGCGMENRGIVREQVTEMPNGDSIVVDMSWEAGGADGPYVYSSPVAAVIRPDGSIAHMNTVVGSYPEGCRAPSFSDGVVKTSGTDKVWVVKNGKVIASFDLAQNLAILAPHAQPTWATTE